MKIFNAENKFRRDQSDFFDKFVKDIKALNLSDELLAEKIELNSILDLIPNASSKRILDLGCGTARVGLRLAPKCKEVIGLDISGRSIDIANITAKKYKIHNFKGIVGGMEEIDYTHYFDCVVMVNLLHHVDDIDNLFSSIRRVLKSDGLCIIFEMNPLNPLFPFFMLYLGSFRNHFNKEYFRGNIFLLKRILKRNGFIIKKIKKYAFLPTFLYNYSLIFKKINEVLNKIPIIEEFCAFHIIQFSPKSKRYERN